MAVVFDTYKQHQSLVAAGFTAPQAVAVTDMATAVLGVVATKPDVEKLESKIDARLDGIDKRLDDFHQTLGRMNSLMIGIIGATVSGIGIVVGAMFVIVTPHLR